MRGFTLILVCAVIASVTSEPDPKKYKAGDGEKDKKSASLTDDEKTFLREVEEKFGVKSEIPIEIGRNSSDEIISTNTTQKAPFPAVIAIEIVNDTDSKTKGKRTIDANLGYGYRTNNGYTYTYFGKPTQEKGKFMIYPYSQQDGSSHNSHSVEYRQQQQIPEKHSQTSVEIQPSQAFELVSVQDERHYIEKPISSPSPQTYTSDAPATPSTLYTTYNGQELSGLSGHFPSLQSNYFVEPKQLLENPQYQEVGLNQDYLSTNSLDQNRPVVPVLVLRIPSSYLKNPTAELYANLPNNYPLSHYLNNVNLQGLVNQYFKKNGYNSAPQVMAYQNPHIVSSPITPTVSSTYSTEPQQYSNPHVQPTYTQSDYSGVHYSAVKPVMAKYPSVFSRQKHISSHSQSYYRRPVQQQKYENRYQHAPQAAFNTQAYYGHSEYQSPQQPTVATYELQNEQAVAKPTIETASSDVGSHQYASGHDTKTISVEYDNNVPSHSSEVSENHNNERPQYEYSKEIQAEYSPQQASSQEYTGQSLSQYTASELASRYYSQKQASAEALSAYPSHATSAEQSHQTYSDISATQGYDYPKPGEEQVSNSYVIPESYPEVISKDHTIATVLPYTYTPLKRPNTATVQTVSYVTPMPHASKYLSRFRVMVPQTILKSQDSEKVTYVNSMPMHYTKTGYPYGQDHGSEEQYNIGTHYVTKQKHPSYPRNYHSYLKRMTRPENKAEGPRHTSLHPSKHNEKKSS